MFCHLVTLMQKRKGPIGQNNCDLYTHTPCLHGHAIGITAHGSRKLFARLGRDALARQRNKKNKKDYPIHCTYLAGKMVCNVGFHCIKLLLLLYHRYYNSSKVIVSSDIWTAAPRNNNYQPSSPEVQWILVHSCTSYVWCPCHFNKKGVATVLYLLHPHPFITNNNNNYLWSLWHFLNASHSLLHEVICPPFWFIHSLTLTYNCSQGIPSEEAASLAGKSFWFFLSHFSQILLVCSCRWFFMVTRCIDYWRMSICISEGMNDECTNGSTVYRLVISTIYILVYYWFNGFRLSIFRPSVMIIIYFTKYS